MCRGVVCSSLQSMAGKVLEQGEMRHLTHHLNAPHPPEFLPGSFPKAGGQGEGKWIST